jgi:hypothetical protein
VKTQESDYVSFQRACAMLAEKLKATREEVALWAWLEKKYGGIDAYITPKPSACCNADRCDDYNHELCGDELGGVFAPPRQHGPAYDQVGESAKPWTWLLDAYFLRSEIDSFNPSPKWRCISWNELVARWGERGLDESDVRQKIRGRIRANELDDCASLYGVTELCGLGDGPATWAMFPLVQIKAIEARDFPGNAGDAVKVGAGRTAEESPAIPGKLSPVAIGKLAATAAWQIECESGRAATADKVMERLQKWATDGTHSDVLLRSDEKKKHAVIWRLKKTGSEKSYDIEACGKALETWMESRD